MKRTDIEMTDYLKSFLNFDLGHMNMANFSSEFLDIPYYQDVCLDMYLPDKAGPHPVMLIIYGGGWVSGFKQSKYVEPMLQPLRHGYACIVPNYTLALDASYPQAVIDLKHAIRWVKKHAAQYHLDASRITLWGESAGGHLCLLTGLMDDTVLDMPAEEVDSSVNHLIAFYPMINIETADQQMRAMGIDNNPRHNAKDSVFGIFMGSHFQDAAMVKEINPENHIKADMPAIVIHHGTADTMVPYMQSVDFYQLVKEKYPDADIKLEIAEGKIHTDPYFFTVENVARIIEFVEK